MAENGGTDACLKGGRTGRLPPRSTFSPSTADVSLVSKQWLRLYRSLPVGSEKEIYPYILELDLDTLCMATKATSAASTLLR
ncbi:hypothetical protein RHMOL_Rhmol08G0058100 [Rhododendron molle]|uniref:Uncharacterized protein n=1 Tax=Rhododendron molle TaxID=49168 RepID=A0ACC0MM97_RHOML|nr:hypothetical protein RHMOL_Rhmol08G0058100 [Rhododendron molle]